MMSMPLPNCRLTAASTWMPGILASSAPFAPSITESPIAVTCGAGGGTVGVVGVAARLPGCVGVVGVGAVAVVVVVAGCERNASPDSMRRRLRRREADPGDEHA